MKYETAEVIHTIVAVIVILSIVALIAMVGSELIYGDWRCAFAECRIIKEAR